MSGATTIVIVRDDLSMPGIVKDPSSKVSDMADEQSLIETLDTKKPDVVVLDCRGPTRNGLPAIEKIRSRTTTPILVIYEAGDPLQRAYEVSGVAGCLPSPFDIQTFNGMLIEISGSNRTLTSAPRRARSTIQFSGLTFRPHDDTITSGGTSAQLTTAESRLLLHLLEKPWEVCSRAEISDSLYGPHRPVSDRAIDAIVARLRKKLSYVLADADATVIKTEFRLGFTFVGQIETSVAA